MNTCCLSCFCTYFHIFWHFMSRGSGCILVNFGPVTLIFSGFVKIMYTHNLNLWLFKFQCPILHIFNFGVYEVRIFQNWWKIAATDPRLPPIVSIVGLDCAWGVYFLFKKKKFWIKFFFHEIQPDQENFAPLATGAMYGCYAAIFIFFLDFPKKIVPMNILTTPVHLIS